MEGPTPTPDGYQKHPCNKFGACRFGTECRFAQYPISACVFFLRGHCAIGLRCRYDHVREWDFFVNSEAAQRSRRRSSNFVAPGRPEAGLSGTTPNTPKPHLQSPSLKPPPLHGAAARSNAIQGHGSYADYYHYRKDNRVEVLRPHEALFLHRHALDIGCNTGEFTLQFAQAFRCNSMLGVDIDARLIGTAQKALGKYVNLPPAGFVPLSAVLSQGPLPPVPEVLQEKVVCGVDFRHEDWLASADPVGPYGIILCMSVTKWVHLSGGDAALERLFRKTFASLRPGGLFVLEPQPWTSYKKKLQLYTEEQRQHFKEIRMRPTSFVEFLTTTVGFDFITSISGAKVESTGEDSKKRPLEEAVGPQPKRQRGPRIATSPAAPPGPLPTTPVADQPEVLTEPTPTEEEVAAAPPPSVCSVAGAVPQGQAPAADSHTKREPRRAAPQHRAFQGSLFDRTIFLFRKSDADAATA